MFIIIYQKEITFFDGLTYFIYMTTQKILIKTGDIYEYQYSYFKALNDACDREFVKLIEVDNDDTSKQFGKPFRRKVNSNGFGGYSIQIYRD